MIGSASPYNANHFNDPEYNRLYAQAISTTSEATREQLVGQLAHVDYDRGGYIVPVFSPSIEAYTSNVGGVTDYVTGVSPNNADFKKMWLAS
jgi:peptide/nickel transport system substrate-binding protein